MFQTRRKLEELLERETVRRAEAEREKAQAEERWRESGDALRRMTEEIEALKEAAARHDETIEDMLDEWSDWRGEQASLEKTLQGYTAREREAAAARERELLTLLMGLRDQLFTLGRAAEQAGDSGWSRQLTLSLEVTDTALLQGGLQVFGRPGEPFQYELHEAVSTAETSDRESDMRIAEVLAAGWNDRGKLLRRAKVTVYRYIGDHPS